MVPVSEEFMIPSALIKVIAEEKHCLVIEIKVKEESRAANKRMLTFLFVKYLVLIIVCPRESPAEYVLSLKR